MNKTLETWLYKIVNQQRINGGFVKKRIVWNNEKLRQDYGKDFIALISKYVEENDIIRPEDLIVKTTGANSALKLFIIQNIDKKLPLPDIAKAKGLSIDEFLKEMEQIVYSGTKININYWIDEILDEEQQEELHDYFLNADTDKISVASKEFGGDYEDDELRLYRIKFISEVGN